MSNRLLAAEKIVVALGGNALQRGQDVFSLEAMKEALAVVCDVFRDKALVVVHGNGPQVTAVLKEGMTFSQAIKITQDKTFELALEAMNSLGISTSNVELHNTRVIVDPLSSAFRNPTKPVGPWVNSASELESLGHDYIEKNGVYRRVVPSPEPLEIIDYKAINDSLDNGKIVFAGGGGGVPVNSRDRELNVDAVIDKDRVAELLRERVKANLLVILTAVPGYIKDFGSENARLILRMKYADALRLGEDDEMAGSMGPKLIAAGLAASRGKVAVITDFSGLRKMASNDESSATIVTLL
ncbi:hypothetical protein COU74_01620 [Candidatus Peregrinibacteria bacterium CG10_big_fil_rev_8_21_14_0_10_36_19]|nr:MAG: hypothetical protein COU74_01620 [Candidatus Peregrinibacteria bacterium CG10_big_fil_rev_8_21_14_0_10_36_19]